MTLPFYGQPIVRMDDDAVAGGAVDYPESIIRLDGDDNYCRPGWYARGSVTAGSIADLLYLYPIFVNRETTYDQIAIFIVTLAAGAVGRMGLYRPLAGSNPVPDSLHTDWGTVSVATTGSKLISATFTLDRGLYWLAWISDGAPNVRVFDEAESAYGPMEGFDDLSSDVPNGCGVTVSAQAGVAVGGLPATAPTHDGQVGVDAPSILFRKTAFP